MNFTEAQYRRYVMFLEAIGNTDDFVEGYRISQKLKNWLKKEGISNKVEEEMGERVLQEDIEKFGLRK